jgi:hypothetical protein
MRVSNEIDVCDVEGNEFENFDKRSLRVESHDHRKGLVVLKYGDMVISVPAEDLKTAVVNATRTE